ncbi:MAG TPA: FAD-binding oxidoreductase [Acidobacteriota bacterium]
MISHPGATERSLEGDIAADIGVVGAGFTGLWTALCLKELQPAINVVIVEKAFAGYGGSGRNAGIVGETVDHSHGLAVRHFGKEEAMRLVSIGVNNFEQMVAFLTANQIDCEYEPTGRLHVALTEEQVCEAKRNLDAAVELGVRNLQFLDAQQIQAEIHSPLYRGAVFSPTGGILNPMKLIDGLKKTAIRQGIRIFENSPGLRIGKGKLETAGGALHAEKIVLAMDAYTHHLQPALLKRFIPLYDYIVVSRQLTASELEKIGWKRRQGVTDDRTFFNYYRLTSDKRIVWGTSEAKYYAPNRVDEAFDHSEQHYDALRTSFRKHFPQMGDLPFEYAWGGPIASTTRLTPFFGALEKDRLLYGLGYTGHGIAASRLGGKILAHLALETPSDLLNLSLVRKKPFPFPPEPLRSVAVKLVTRSLRQVDEGRKAGWLLQVLDHFGIGFSS